MKYLLLMLALAVPLWATQNTIAGGNWSAASILTTDTVTVTGTTSNDTIDGNFTFVAYKRPASNSRLAIETGTTSWTITGNGNIAIDSGVTGAKSLPDSVKVSGTGKVVFASGSGVISSSNSAWLFSGVDTLNDNKGITIKSYATTAGIGVKLTVNGAASTTLLCSNECFTLGDSSTLIWNKVTNLALQGNDSLWRVGAGCVINGTAPPAWAGAGNLRISLPKFTYSGTGTMTLQGSANDTFSIVGQLSLGNAPAGLTINNFNSGVVWNTNNNTIDCGALTIGQVTATATATYNFGTSSVSISSLAASNAAYTTGSCVVNYSGSWTILGNETWGANWTINPGTGTVTHQSNSATITTNNRPCFYNLTLNGDTKTYTFADSLKVAGTYTITAGNITHSGQGIVAAGDVLFNSTGTANWGNFVTLNGATSQFHIGSTAGTQTATSTNIYCNQATAGILDIDKASSFKSLTLGVSAIVTNSGAATLSFGNTTPLLILGNSSTFTNNTNVQFNPGASSFTLYTIGTGAAFNGTGNILNDGAFTNTYTIPEITYTGSGTWGFQSSSSPTWSLGGNFSCGTRALTVQEYSTGNMTFNSNNYSITCGTIDMGSSAIGGTFTGNFGSSIINCGIRNNSLNNGTNTYNMNSSVWNCNSHWVLGTTHNVIYGTSIVRLILTSAVGVTSVGKKFWDFRLVGNPTSKLTLNDSLKCTYFTDSSGKFVQNSNPIIVDSNYANVSPDSAFMSANIVIGKNYTRGTPTIVNRTGGSIILDTTKTVHFFTANGNQIGPVVCKDVNFTDSSKIQKLTLSDSALVTFMPNFGVNIDTIGKFSGSVGKLVYMRSSTPGAQARLWVPGNSSQTYMYWKDICVNGGIITCPWSNGCRSSGGNKCP
jgi:hypothetical protein